MKATPLSGCVSWRGAMRVAHWLASSARSGSGGLEDGDFWYSAAEKLLAPLLFAAAERGGEMADVIRWLNESAEAEPDVSRRLAESGPGPSLLRVVALGLIVFGAYRLVDAKLRVRSAVTNP